MTSFLEYTRLFVTYLLCVQMSWSLLYHKGIGILYRMFIFQHLFWILVSDLLMDSTFWGKSKIVYILRTGDSVKLLEIQLCDLVLTWWLSRSNFWTQPIWSSDITICHIIKCSRLRDIYMYTGLILKIRTDKTYRNLSLKRHHYNRQLPFWWCQFLLFQVWTIFHDISLKIGGWVQITAFTNLRIKSILGSDLLLDVQTMSKISL